MTHATNKSQVMINKNYATFRIVGKMMTCN